MKLVTYVENFYFLSFLIYDILRKEGDLWTRDPPMIVFIRNKLIQHVNKEYNSTFSHLWSSDIGITIKQQKAYKNAKVISRPEVEDPGIYANFKEFHQFLVKQFSD